MRTLGPALAQAALAAGPGAVLRSMRPVPPQPAGERAYVMHDGLVHDFVWDGHAWTYTGFWRPEVVRRA